MRLEGLEVSTGTRLSLSIFLPHALVDLSKLQMGYRSIVCADENLCLLPNTNCSATATHEERAVSPMAALHAHCAFEVCRPNFLSVSPFHSFYSTQVHYLTHYPTHTDPQHSVYYYMNISVFPFFFLRRACPTPPDPSAVHVPKERMKRRTYLPPVEALFHHSPAL
jgi:hypothetical protein